MAVFLPARPSSFSMKKNSPKLPKSLSLDREIIVKLDEYQLLSIEGGQHLAQTTQTQSSCPAFSCNPVECRGELTAE